MTLPAHVIAMDSKLEAAFDDASNSLMEHRWHWTLDESNPKRVSISEYARQVGKSRQTISADANGWADYTASTRKARPAGKVPGQAKTPEEFRQLANLGAEKQAAAEAIARTTGRSINSAARDHEALNAVVSKARDKAARRGTTVEHEIDQAAAERERASKAAAKLKDERKKRMTAAYISIEGDIGAMLQRGKKILKTADAIEFGADETELLADALGKLRALLNLLDMRFTGEANVDWDAELEKIS
jgi:hypothetical protein